MTLYSLLRRIWNWLPPQTWPEVFATIGILLLLFLATATIIDMLKGTLP